jgi:hypothetical protein
MALPRTLLSQAASEGTPQRVTLRGAESGAMALGTLAETKVPRGERDSFPREPHQPSQLETLKGFRLRRKD